MKMRNNTRRTTSNESSRRVGKTLSTEEDLKILQGYALPIEVLNPSGGDLRFCEGHLRGSS